MTFRSKIDWWLVLLVLAVPAWRIATEWVDRGIVHPPVSFWLLVGLLTLLGIALVPIRYVIQGRTVSVQCGGLIGWEYTAFPVEDVQSIRPTHNPLASPALSLDRLKVDLGFRGNLLISPKDKVGFLHAISALDPQLRPEDSSLVRSG